ncbi:hypothetical protein M1N77_01085 [Thermodesulfovibrionales bacterium]|nr:hypothetical protein [Thermodesulfovibrionales bacterium]MCL0083111.1 hypothetical protein [Thermodesulfovibrionales bacterium]
MTKRELLFIEIFCSSLFFGYIGKNFFVILKKQINNSGIQKAPIRKLFKDMNNAIFGHAFPIWPVFN